MDWTYVGMIIITVQKDEGVNSENLITVYHTADLEFPKKQLFTKRWAFLALWIWREEDDVWVCFIK